MKKNSKVYKLDRLGFPLVEIATGPHMHTPQQIKETALKIERFLEPVKKKRDRNN
jgi:glutamyl-tRNA(Gln) amidotransferase subunit E